MIKPEDKLLLAEAMRLYDPSIQRRFDSEHRVSKYICWIGYKHCDGYIFEPETNDAQRMACIDWAAKEIRAMQMRGNKKWIIRKEHLISAIMDYSLEQQIEFCIELAKEVSGGN